MYSLTTILYILHTANALIDYPINPRLYATLQDTHLAGPSYKAFDAYVCNKDTYAMCKSAQLHCIGIAKDIMDLQYYHNAYALLTYENTTLVDSYDVPVLGLASKHIDFGLKAVDPFFVHVYPFTSSDLFFKYIIIGILACIALGMVYRCTLSNVMQYLHKRRIMKTVTYNEENLLNSNCTICLDEFENEEQVVTLTECKHVFHKTCINTWLDTKKTCPNCQNPIV